MTSLFSTLPIADSQTGIFNSLEKGSTQLNGPLLADVANFVGALAVLAGVVFLVVAVMKTRDKIRWFWMSGAAFLVGAMLLLGAAPMIQHTAGNSWSEVFQQSAILSSFLHF